jgi:mono/diheme cytochrome c family protein/plastocyanin
MHRAVKSLGLAITCVLPFVTLASTTYEPATAGAGNAGAGKLVYERYCIQCHGEKGDGKGESAPWLVPKPRNFTTGLYKFRSTPDGKLPLVSDLYHTITYGLYGTGMTPFGAIEPRARLDVIAYIMTFSARWQKEPRATPIDIRPETDATTESAIRGYGIFKRNCSMCHGDGSGDGPMASKTVDASGDPDPPANLTRGRGKQEVTAHDIYRTFMTGITGSPMGAFAGAILPDSAWDVVHYIESLGPWKESNAALRLAKARNYGVTPVTPAMPASGSAADSGSATTGATTTVMKMSGGETTDPNEIDIRVGDIVTFKNDGGGAHNVAFFPDSIPDGAKAQLQANMPNTSGPLIGPMMPTEGDTYTISFDKLPPGKYVFYCTPHQGKKERGTIVVR